jgi:hypothetical protein
MANLAIWRRKIRAEVVSTTHNNADQIKFEASLFALSLSGNGFYYSEATRNSQKNNIHSFGKLNYR